VNSLPYAVAATLLIAATYINGFMGYHLFGGTDFLDFVGTLISAPMGILIAATAFAIIRYSTRRRAFATHPLLSGFAALNIIYPVGRLMAFFLRAQ
jgi:hypothetical protein